MDGTKKYMKARMNIAITHESLERNKSSKHLRVESALNQLPINY